MLQERGQNIKQQSENLLWDSLSGRGDYENIAVYLDQRDYLVHQLLEKCERLLV